MGHQEVKKALLITAYDRLRYFQEVLYSWHSVRQLDEWHVVISIDPSRFTKHMVEEAEEFIHHRGLTDVEIVVHEDHLGVYEHPLVMMDRLFAQGYEFVVRAEDDLVVSEDVLEFFEVAAFTYEPSTSVVTAQAWSDDDGRDDVIEKIDRFCPWVWGTWVDRWFDFVSPAWRIDTGVGIHDRGWDWNLQRAFVREGVGAVHPRASRVQNIGEFGEHGTPANYVVSPSFMAHRPWQKWECR